MPPLFLYVARPRRTLERRRGGWSELGHPSHASLRKGRPTLDALPLRFLAGHRPAGTDALMFPRARSLRPRSRVGLGCPSR
jgi:hypothetical protein